MDFKTLLPATVAVLCLTSTALAQTGTPQPATINVAGNATLHATPDEVTINIGVVTQDPDADRAASDNASRLESVLHALHEAIGANADIKTLSFGLTPDYRSESGDRQPEITGYTAANTVQVTLYDLEKVGAVIDAATRSGANRIDNIQFTLRNPEKLHTDALRQAAADAKAQADALAAALGLKVSRVLAVQGGGGYPIPVRPVRMAMARMKSTVRSTPIQAGTLDVHARVTLTVEVRDQPSPPG